MSKALENFCLWNSGLFLGLGRSRFDEKKKAEFEANKNK